MNTVKFEKGNVLMVAHQGLSGIEPGNTNAAFIAAGNRSYYGIETDMHITADGRFVVNHDETILKAAGENIAIKDASLSVLQSALFYEKDKSKTRADLRLCTLENYVSTCKRYEKQCVLELKPAFSDEETAAFIDIIKKLDYIDNVTFISFEYENLVKIRRLIPNQSVQFLFHKLTDEIIERVIADGFDVDAYYKTLNADVVKRFHDAGVKINCWTVDTKEEAEVLVKMGVDYITSNILE